ncbi:MAG: flagellar basal body P-ring formation chaperone FlgA [Alphaproteobacteria bacterium]|nr:flagellar basal body P-ring formation chaperone FlgA [Alphaproteobacteria bacterium]MCL2505338.1 flagellar basal body P-ring formation chaperone FlgA [Alphaproteobacteria bacterium]
MYKILLATVVFLFPVSAHAGIAVNKDIELTEPIVRLSHVFSGIPKDKDRDIAAAPQPCKTIVYSKDILNRLAKTYNLNIKDIAEDTTVSSPCTRVSNAALKSLIEDHVKSNNLINRSFSSIEVVPDKRAMNIEVPENNAEDFDLEDFSYDHVSKQFSGVFSADTRKGKWTRKVFGKIMLNKLVPVFAREAEAASTISEYDISWIEMQEEKIAGDIIIDKKQIIGKELRKMAREGDFIRIRDIVPARLVRKDEMVTLKVQTPSILITVQGKALDTGAKGDTVKVLNTQSNRTVEGTVVAAGIVEVVSGTNRMYNMARN